MIIQLPLLCRREEMSVDEKIAQFSCTIPLTITKHESGQNVLIDQEIPQGIGRFTQYAGGFFEGTKAAAEAYNQIQA